MMGTLFTLSTTSENQRVLNGKGQEQLLKSKQNQSRKDKVEQIEIKGSGVYLK